MNAYSGKLQDIMETFALLDSWEERYRYLIDLGRALPAMAEAEKTEETRVQGCVSQVWMVAHIDADGIFHLKADSDAHIVHGLIAILHAACEGLPVAEVAALDFEALFADLGLEDNLSPNRRNGFYAMVQRVKALARAAEGGGRAG